MYLVAEKTCLGKLTSSPGCRFVLSLIYMLGLFTFLDYICVDTSIPIDLYYVSAGFYVLYMGKKYAQSLTNSDTNFC